MRSALHLAKWGAVRAGILWAMNAVAIHDAQTAIGFWVAFTLLHVATCTESDRRMP